MGVYIPKMILPENCEDCPFFMDEEFTWCGRASYNICDGLVTRQGKPSWCDLVEVKPHGRLIDADMLTTVTEMVNGKWKTYIEVFEVDDAPTIIESEGEE